ncbi:MAG: hypothetical protein Q8R44_13735 [Novosphingobium sp.]|nr:hypothetical protein [Novosphingobium sp.]
MPKPLVNVALNGAPEGYAVVEPVLKRRVGRREKVVTEAVSAKVDRAG